jgi:hypothetical protein
MPVGFGMSIMPGVRVRASTRGIGVGLGPRAARLNVGSGGLGVSSGIGPFYASTGLGRRRSRTSSAQRSLSAFQRALHQAQRAHEIAEIAKEEQQLVSVHLEEFTPSHPPQASSVEAVNRPALLQEFYARAVSNIPWYKRSERRAAKEIAAQQAEYAIQEEERRRADAQAIEQAGLDAAWQQLLNNDPQTVLTVLEGFFEDNHTPAAPIDCQGDEVRIIMLYDSPDLVPDYKPALTTSGNPTLAKRNKTERNELYAASLSSNVLATAKEAFAVAPSIHKVAVMVLRKDEVPQRTQPVLSCLYCGRFESSRFAQLDWPRVDPLAEISNAPGALIKRKGRTAEVAPVDISDIPDLEAVLQSVAEALGCEANSRAASFKQRTTARPPSPTFQEETSQAKFSPETRQGRRDRDNYILLLEDYEGNLDVMEQLCAIREENLGQPEVEQQIMEVRDKIYSNLERPGGIFEKLNILEARNTGMLRERAKRTELQGRQSSIESQLPPRM